MAAGNPRRVVLVGGGLASAAAAHTLRAEGFAGAITLVCAESHLPYERPPLSKGYLRGEVARGDLPFPSGEWYASAGVDVRLGRRAVRLDAATREVELGDGTRLRADAVLVATGGAPRRLPQARGGPVLTLRTIEDADRLAAALGPGRRLVGVGAGFIGLEVAASARLLGTDVALVEALAAPMQQALGAAVSQRVAAIHRGRGVALHTGERVTAIDEGPAGVVVTTASGERLEADAAVVGIGIAPQTAIATASGLEVDDGIVVDASCRTSAPGVYAAGDVAAHDHPLHGRRRVEHYDNALRQGAVAARNMLGRDAVHDAPHWFWSDQYDHNIQLVGDTTRHDDVVIRGTPEGEAFTAFYLRGGVVRAVLAVDRPRDVRVGRRLVAALARPPPAALADDATDLRLLLPRR